MKKENFTLLICALFLLTSHLSAQILDVEHVTENAIADEISAALGENPASSITTLNVTGSANLTLDDCKAIKSSLPSLKNLDLSNAKFADNKTPDGTTAANSAFGGNANIETVIFPPDLTAIGNRTFQAATGLISVTIPDGVTTIGDYAFYQCGKLALSTLPIALSSIGLWAFRDCVELRVSSLPSGLTSMPIRVFENCQKVTISEFPAGTTAISNYSFQNCYAVENLIFPADLTAIGTNSFRNCTGLISIRFKSTTPPTVGEYAFQGVALDDITIYVPQGASGSFNVSPWNTMKEIIEETLTSFGSTSAGEVRVFPNPAKGEITLMGSKAMNSIALFDLSGRIIKRLEPTVDKIDISQLSNGVYLLKIDNEAIKIVKE